MMYGQGGQTPKFNTHEVGTGGYCKITQESETSFSNSSSKQVKTYELVKEDTKYYAVVQE